MLDLNKAMKDTGLLKGVREFSGASAKLALLVEYVKQKMKPILYDAGFIEKLKRDVFVSENDVVIDIHTI